MSNDSSIGGIADIPARFTWPFCHTPHPLIVEESRRLMDSISSSLVLSSLFKSGKMLGVLMVQDTSTGRISFLHGFSGLAGGKSIVEGFVPPIFDTAAADIDSSSADESRHLQNWLFSKYIVHNYRGESRSILEIFADWGLVPPGGTGDCAAPKMMEYAYRNGLKPLAMGEFWYGKSPEKEVRRQGCFYPSCTGKCGPLLRYMMQGLEVDPDPLESDTLWELGNPVIRYEDTDIVVVEKPSGILAVPGRSRRKSLQEWLAEQCGSPVTACHRLDMDTSGLMVFAKSAEALASLQRQFEERSVRKSYLARLCPAADGRILSEGDNGKICLPLYPDYYDRPRQMVDFENGRMAVTRYSVRKVFDDGTIEVLFIPHTGRTHQLRVHAAHQFGLGHPICGDRLYGGNTGNGASSRLMLHAAHLSFRHPADFSRMTFDSGI
ncbi:MAG: RluA family pseudouridine synthase [Bacteroidales bacterium]|nr:RluA family pseudouridine synthase [Candidatus Cacconaster merdequi]